MRITRMAITMALLCALTMLVAGWRNASPPSVPTSDEGVIVYLDYAAKNLTLASSECGQRVLYHWSETTRFMRRGVRAGPEQFEPGMEVLVYYKTHAGRALLTEVLWKKDPIYVSTAE